MMNEYSVDTTVLQNGRAVKYSHSNGLQQTQYTTQYKHNTSLGDIHVKYALVKLLEYFLKKIYMLYIYYIAGKFGRAKVWRIYSF